MGCFSYDIEPFILFFYISSDYWNEVQRCQKTWCQWNDLFIYCHADTFFYVATLLLRRVSHWVKSLRPVIHPNSLGI